MIPADFTTVKFRGSATPLSNMWMESLDIGLTGAHFPSLEHAYQYLKGLCAHVSDNLLAGIRAAHTSYKAKRLAKAVRFNRTQKKLWDNCKIVVMKALLELKFQQSTRFRESLKAGEAYQEDVIETFWGIGSDDDPGENILGRLLTTLATEQTLRTLTPHHHLGIQPSTPTAPPQTHSSSQPPQAHLHCFDTLSH